MVCPGRMGTRLAEICHACFGMIILYCDVVSRGKAKRKLGTRPVDLETLLHSSDYVSFHVPLIDGTCHFISNRELEPMKPTPYLVNTSRGVVDEIALVSLPRKQDITGAALDIFEIERTVKSNRLFALSSRGE